MFGNVYGIYKYLLLIPSNIENSILVCAATLRVTPYKRRSPRV